MHIIPSEARFLLGVQSNAYGFAKFLKARFWLLDLYRSSSFLHALLRSFPTLRQTDNGYSQANVAKLNSTHGQISLSSPAHTTALSHPLTTTWPFTIPVEQQGWLYCIKMDLQISARRETLALSETSLSATVLDHKRCIKMSPTYRNFLSFILLPTTSLQVKN